MSGYYLREIRSLRKRHKPVLPCSLIAHESSFAFSDLLEFLLPLLTFLSGLLGVLLKELSTFFLTFSISSSSVG